MPGNDSVRPNISPMCSMEGVDFGIPAVNCKKNLNTGMANYTARIERGGRMENRKNLASMLMANESADTLGIETMGSCGRTTITANRTAANGRKQTFTWLYNERLVMTQSGRWQLAEQGTVCCESPAFLSARS